jgi:2-iminobutanoate/2-iminopropanoate deaminase
VRCGEWVTVSGQVVGAGDAAAQARQCFANIEAALAEAGASLSDIVTLRCYLTDKSAYGYADIKSVLFKDKSPASTTVIISALLIPALLMEVEAVAWMGKLK